MRPPKLLHPRPTTETGSPELPSLRLRCPREPVETGGCVKQPTVSRPRARRLPRGTRRLEPQAVRVRRVLQRTAGRHEAARRAPTESGTGKSGTDQSGTDQSGTEKPAAVSTQVWAGVWVLAAGLGALGLLMRLWLLWHRSINSDEAVVGLMARDILHGHFSAFYWGQDYGGVEPYVTAALFGVFGQNDVTLNLAPAVLSAASSVLVWRIARYVLAEPVAVLVGLATWVWPVAVVVYSTQESGFRYATLTLGLTAVLFATQIRCRGSTWPRWLCFGLSIGACVWSSPESVYFVVPCALLAVPALRSSRTVGSVAVRLGSVRGGGCWSVLFRCCGWR